MINSLSSQINIVFRLWNLLNRDMNTKTNYFGGM